VLQSRAAVGRAFRRLPIRWRLTLTFAAVMAVLLAALIAFLYYHFRSDLDYNINQSLSARAQDIADLVARQGNAGNGGTVGQLPTSDGNVAQVLDRSGTVLSASPGSEQPPLLGVRELPTASGGSKLISRGESLRLYALPLSGGRRTVVVGVSLAERDAALDKLDQALLIGVPPALALATLAAYFLAAAALRPVERMRGRAATISADEIGTRLPLPDSDDEIRRLGETLNEMLDRLEDALEHERVFVANASHELRMPLAVLKAELEVSLRERGGERHLRSALSSAAEEADRIIRLAEDLLLLARAQDGTLPITPIQMTVDQLLVGAGERFIPAVGRADRELVIDIESIPREMSVRVDPDRLEQAISNLIDNSLRYGAGPITLSARPAVSSVEIHVSDHGPGFGEFLPHAFDRFSRAASARPRGGVGLGLAIVRTIAQAHGGDAGADDLPGAGADVWISLPASAAGGLRAGEDAGLRRVHPAPR
jgi:two-component system OmpR family sensor kinase